MVIACLTVIGAWDVRPRIGGVAEVDGLRGTIVRVTPKDKLCVQIHETGENRKVFLPNLKLMPQLEFNFDRMPLGESLIKTWASLLLNRQNSTLNSHERKPLHGQVNAAYLRTQQNTLSALNATRMLNLNQYKLRKVLKHAINGMDQSQEQQSIEEELNQQPVLLIQKLLAKATQPSPLKPGFGSQEMQLAALNLSQYLAAEGNFGSSGSVVTDKTTPKYCTRCNSEVQTPNSECSVKSVVSEKTNKRKEMNEDVPVHPMVAQIVEMGFTKRAVETAIKSLGEKSSRNRFFAYRFCSYRTGQLDHTRIHRLLVAGTPRSCSFGYRVAEFDVRIRHRIGLVRQRQRDATIRTICKKIVQNFP
jgi:E3 ubiquitin-protein ligase HERC2